MALESPPPPLSHSHLSDSVKADIRFMLENLPDVKDHFDVLDLIGEGTFSKVYRARVKGDKQKREFALKYIIPTSHPTRIARELRCLKEVEGCKNVIRVKTCILHRGHFVIVMPHIPHERFSDIMQTMSHAEAKEYIINLLIALERVHFHHIIHRDIKPSNFLYDRHQKRYSLVDFGLAQHMNIQLKKRAPLADISSQDSVKLQPSDLCSKKRERSQDQENKLYKKRKVSEEIPSSSSTEVHHRDPSTSLPPLPIHRGCSCFGKPFVCQICLNRKAEIAPRAGTPGFRAPEVLLKFKDQTTAVDMWSVGVIFLSLLSSKYPFFRAPDDMTALAEIVSLLGTKKVQQAAAQLGKKLTMSENKPTLDLKVLCQRLRRPAREDGWSNVPDSAYDLLGKLLEPNPFLRISAEEALTHPYLAT